MRTYDNLMYLNDPKSVTWGDIGRLPEPIRAIGNECDACFGTDVIGESQLVRQGDPYS